MESELEVVLEGDSYKTLLGYDNVELFVNEVINLKLKWLAIFKTPMKISFWQKKNEEDFSLLFH